MARILFVEPQLRTDKLGIMYLSAVLKDAGHEVDLVMGIDDAPRIYASAPWMPDFIMYSVSTGDHDWYINTNRRLKGLSPPFISVMGGPHFTFFPEDGLNDPDIDYVVRGPGEGVILQLVDSPPDAKLVTGMTPNLSALPFPDRALLYKYPQFGGARMKRFMACRDCMWACAYCFNHLYHRIFKEQKSLFYQRATPAEMVGEIIKVRDEWGLELVYFNDDDLAADRQWLMEFCEILHYATGLEFCGSVRADSLDEELIETMVMAGCTFMNVAVESANRETQRLIRRGQMNNADILDAVRRMETAGIKVRLQNMIGLPVDDPLADALETYEFNVLCSPTDSWAAITQPFPKTDLWRISLERGLIDEDTECTTFVDSTVMKFAPDVAEKINRLHKWWYFAVKWRLPTEVLRELIEIPLTDSQKNVLQSYRWEEAARVLYEL